MRGEGNATSSAQFFLHSSCLLGGAERSWLHAGQEPAFLTVRLLILLCFSPGGCFAGISYQNKLHLLRLWYHESCRVFSDRLVSKDDRTWFGNLMKSTMEELGTTFEEVVPSQPVLFGDFMEPGANIKLYQEIDSQEKVRILGVLMMCLLQTKAKS